MVERLAAGHDTLLPLGCRRTATLIVRNRSAADAPGSVQATFDERNLPGRRGPDVFGAGLCTVRNYAAR
jgi:hypothetical protein